MDGVWVSPRAGYPAKAATAPSPFRSVFKLTDQLWELQETKDLIEAAKRSAFIRGIKDNTLDPRGYGIYHLQDGCYLASARDNFCLIQHNPNNTPALQSYFARKVDSYTQYTSDLFRSWHINEQVQGAVRLSPAARDYLSFEASVVAYYPHAPCYFALANYPCFRLWPEMARWLAGELGSARSVYQDWIDANQDLSSADKLSNLVEAHHDTLEFEAAKTVFLTALKYEVAFFDSVAQAF